MKSELSHKERLVRILKGQDIDRPAISAWRHFYNRENTSDDLVEAMIEFQRNFDWDFMKINPRASYFIEDWGAKFIPSQEPLVKATKISLPVNKINDWVKIRPLTPTIGSLGEILDATREIVKRVGSEIHIMQTVFSPLSIAGDMVDDGDAHFVELLREGPNELHRALESITETFVAFVRKLMSTGISGIFFATTEWASRDLLTEDEYLEFGRKYDLEVLKAAQIAEFNIVHVCNKNNMLPLFKDYPAPILSWNPYDDGNLSIHQAAQISNKVILAGMNQITLLNGSSDLIQKQIEDALCDAPQGRLMLGPGCALKVSTPDQNLKTAIDTVRKWMKT
jgi:uroporphyrinogen decarboxylase